MMALFLDREVLVPKAPPGPPGASVPTQPQDVWLGVFVPGDRRVGYIHAKTAPESLDGKPGARMDLKASLQLSLLGEAADILVDGEVWSAASGESSNFEFSVRTGEHDLSAKGRVGGGRLTGEVQTAGERIPLDMPLSGNPLFTGGMGSVLTMPVPRPGEEFSVTTFDPVTLSASPARVAYAGRQSVTVGGEAVPATVIEVTSNGIASRVWLSADNEVLRAETPYGLTLARITPEEAGEALPADPEGARDLLDTLAIRPTGVAPFRGAKSLRISVSGLNADTPLPEDEHQRSLGKGEYSIVASEARETTAAAEPEGGVVSFLAADALIQASHPQIRERAKAIVGAETDTWRKAQALYRWVYENIEKQPVLSVPSALEVLKTRQGDCNEHTVLFTALARSVEVPTRVAVGIVWSDELNGFYYHAWPEVFVGHWVRMDPTLGQELADATHIKLATGDILQWARIVPYMGRLQMKVVDAK